MNRLNPLIPLAALLLGLLSGTDLAAQEGRLLQDMGPSEVGSPPPGFHPSYVKHLDAGGIPILGSAAVSDDALMAARGLVNEMLAMRPDARAEMIKQGFRLVMMAPSEQTTDVPEHSTWRVPAYDDWRLTEGERRRYNEPGGLASQTPSQYWDRRARGMDDNPTTCAEENVLGIPDTRYFGENICVHEFVHSIMMYGLQFSDPELFAEIEAAYEAAMEEGLWEGHYGSTNAKEYFAEAAQTYFDSNYPFTDGEREIRTSEDLRAYDPTVYGLLERVFPSHRLEFDVFHGRHIDPDR